MNRIEKHHCVVKGLRLAGVALWLIGFVGCQSVSKTGATAANRLLYLESPMVYYPDRHFPKLTTPMWTGDPETRAVVILAIDDMHDVKKYDDYLAPIFARLKQIENGKSPLSIFTTKIDPNHPRLQEWLTDGVTIEVHTTNHPCPLLQKNDFENARQNVLDCIDALAEIPNNVPAAFRMPCCDSMNSPSPRFFSEIMARPTPKGNTLPIDSSVFCLLTPDDPALPRDSVLDEGGKPRFGKYLPFHTFVNIIENYPYPYLIQNSIWEFSAIVPSDWEAQHFHGVKNPKTVADFKHALDAIVTKQGVMTLCFHPHGWIGAEQIVELIDHAAKTYGSKVRFMNFRQAADLLKNTLLAGVPVRSADGKDNGVRLLDLDNDGYLDVVIGNPAKTLTRVWNPNTSRWLDMPFPYPLIDKDSRPTGVRFVRIQPDGRVSLLIRNETTQVLHHFRSRGWSDAIDLSDVLGDDVLRIFTAKAGRDRGLRCVDFNGDGYTDLVLNNESQNESWLWNPRLGKWTPSEHHLPTTGLITDATGKDRGHRFVDLDGDGFLDSVQSDEAGYALALYSPETGWTRSVRMATRDETNGEPLPPITEHNRLNGAFFRDGVLFVQNERTGNLPGNVSKHVFAFNQRPKSKQPSPIAVAAHWSFEENDTDSAGGVSDEARPGRGDKNTPESITDVPAAEIYDPITRQSRPNMRSISFDGQDDYLQLGRTNSPDLCDRKMRYGQTLEAFVKLRQPPTGGHLAGLLLGRWTQQSRSGDHFAVFVDTSGALTAEAQAEASKYDETHHAGPAGNIADGNWHHVAASYRFDVDTDTATIRLYLDYESIAEKTYKVHGPLAHSPGPYQLGGEGDGHPKPLRFVNAVFDEVRITTGVLSPDQFLRTKHDCCSDHPAQ